MVVAFTHANAQDLVMNAIHYGTKDGLSHREVHCTFEDRNGLVWIGSRYGLNMFDGESFKWFKQQESGFSFNYISRITQDNEGYLWLWNDEDVAFFHPETEELLSVEERFGPSVPFERKLITSGSWKFWEVRDVIRDEQGRLYLHSPDHQKIIIYDKWDKFEEIDLSELQAFDLRYRLSNGDLVLIHGNQLTVINPQGKTRFTIEPDDAYQINQVFEINGKLSYSYEIKGNEGEWKYLVYDTTSRKSTLIPSLNSSITYFNPIEDTFWSLEDGLWKTFDSKGTLINSYNGKDILPDQVLNYINYFFVDGKGRVWLNSDVGISMLQLNPTLFKRYFTPSDDFLLNTSVRGIWNEEDTLYANLEMGGLVRMNLSDGTWELVDQTLEDPGTVLGDKQVDYWGRPIKKDKDGKFWVGGRRTLRSLDMKEDKVEYYYHKVESDGRYSLIDIWSIHLKEDIIWLGTGNGLAFKDRGAPTIQILPIGDEFREFKSAIVLQIIEESPTEYWLCTNRGLYLFNPKTRNIQARYWAGGNEEHFLPETDIQHIHKDQKGTYWISSISGLIKWNRNTNESQLFDKRNNFPDNNVYGVMEDKEGYLWMSTDAGLVQFDKESFDVMVLTTDDGLPDAEFNRISFFNASDGALFFGGMEGIVSFNPNQLPQRKKQDNRLYITDIQIFNDGTNELEDITQSARKSQSIRLGRDNPYFILDFSLLNYGFRNNKKYAYRINGFSNNWIVLDESKLRVNKMPFGKYTLEIKGYDKGDFNNGDTLTFEVDIPIPFYRTTWFYILMSLGVIGMVVLFFRYRSLIQKRRQEELERQIEIANKDLQEKYVLISEQKDELEKLNFTKDRIFAILGHDLRKPAIAFRGMARKINFLLKKKDYERMEKFGVSIERDALGLNILTDNLLNWAMAQNNSMPSKKEKLELGGIVEEVILTLARLSDDKELHVRNEIEDGIWIYANRSSLLTIIRNIMDNAIKYTKREGVILLQSQTTDKGIEVKIRDSGVGISSDKLKDIFQLSREKSTDGTSGEKGTGLGLHLVYELIKQHDGDIRIESEVGKGTTFFLFFPFEGIQNN